MWKRKLHECRCCTVSIERRAVHGCSCYKRRREWQWDKSDCDRHALTEFFQR